MSEKKTINELLMFERKKSSIYLYRFEGLSTLGNKLFIIKKLLTDRKGDL